MPSIDHLIPNAIVKLKANYLAQIHRPSFLSEIIPDGYSKTLPIDDGILHSLHNFAHANPMFVKTFPIDIASLHCQVYEAEINGYWLSSKKHDSCYQPFYPTWLLSAYALVEGAKSLGFEQLIDIGSGDGRIAYCGGLVGLDSYGIEIDEDLVLLQRKISTTTGVNYTAIHADATEYDYHNLKLSRPIFFISGLPEMGEMMAQGVIEKIVSNADLKHISGFNFMGSHVMKRLSRDHTAWGWGRVISHFGLGVTDTVTLPTYWTTEESVDTAYVFTMCR